jgi:acetoacetyl-CoA synthetase
MKPTPDSANEIVMSAWQRVLQRPSSGPHENFFDLGGDPELACQLFAEISRTSGRELSPLFIYQAPTISTLTALLRQPNPPRLLPLVLLKPGSSVPPVFVTHGLADDLTQLFQLLRHVECPHPVYGLHARGMDGVEEPFERIEEMARSYVDAVKALQAHGPYYLIGYSFGGLVMLEMARRLTGIGEEIGLLVMLDSYPHARSLASRERWRLWTRKVTRFVRWTRKAAVTRPLLVNLRAAGRRLHILQESRSGLIQQALSPSVAALMRRVTESGFLALKRYCPRPYAGPILFLRAKEFTGFPDNPAAVWGKFAPKLEVKTVPGSHTEMLSVHAASLGSILTHHLAESLPSHGLCRSADQ